MGDEIRALDIIGFSGLEVWSFWIEGWVLEKELKAGVLGGPLGSGTLEDWKLWDFLGNFMGGSGRRRKFLQDATQGLQKRKESRIGLVWRWWGLNVTMP